MPAGKAYRIKYIKTALVVLPMTLFLSACSLLTGAERERFSVREEAVELYETGDYEGAIEKFNEALTLSHGEASALQEDILKYRAECELRLKDYAAAAETYGILLGLSEDEEAAGYEELLDGLSSLSGIEDALGLMETGDYEGAYELLSGYAKLGESVAAETAWFYMAVCAEYLGNYEEAEEFFNEYLKFHPEDEDALREAEFSRSRAAGPQ